MLPHDFRHWKLEKEEIEKERKEGRRKRREEEERKDVQEKRRRTGREKNSRGPSLFIVVGFCDSLGQRLDSRHASSRRLIGFSFGEFVSRKWAYETSVFSLRIFLSFSLFAVIPSRFPRRSCVEMPWLRFFSRARWKNSRYRIICLWTDFILCLDYENRSDSMRWLILIVAFA